MQMNLEIKGKTYSVQKLCYDHSMMFAFPDTFETRTVYRRWDSDQRLG